MMIFSGITLQEAKTRFIRMIAKKAPPYSPSKTFPAVQMGDR